MKQTDDLQLSEVCWGRNKAVGFLYIQTDRVVVLLNSVVRSGADLGPLRPIRKQHAMPEATIMVIPSDQVLQINRFRALKKP